VALLLAVLTFAVFAPAARNGFITLDDEQYIYENPQVRQGLTWRTALWALSSTEHANWYPLRRLTHLVDVSLFGMWAGGHHLASAAWHAAATALLFLALRLLTGALWRSFLVAALFGVHPLQVESVAWAAERSNVLAGFFFALTLLLWARYARRPGAGRYAAALAACALGLAAKPILMTLPFLLLLLDSWPLGRLSAPGAPPWHGSPPRLRRCILEQTPLLALAAASGAVALVVHWNAKALTTLESYPLGIRLGNAALSYWRYLGMILWPSGLAVYYPHPMRNLPVGAATLAGLLLAALTVLALAQARRRPWLCAGWLWYLGMLVPMIGIVQFGGHAMADRFAYLPSVGLFLALVWLAAEALPARPRPTAVSALAAVAVIAMFVAASVAQVRLWRDDLTLYAHSLRVTQKSWLVEHSMGFALHRLGRREEALSHYRNAALYGPYPKVFYNLGTVLFELRRFGEAATVLREAVRLKPDYVEAHNTLSFCLVALGRREEALATYREVLRLRPDIPDTWYNFALIQAGLGRTEEAAASLRKALSIRPDFTAAQRKLDEILAGRTRPSPHAGIHSESRPASSMTGAATP
jgi:tetratricopeptide (TPR) repeat protein